MHHHEWHEMYNRTCATNSTQWTDSGLAVYFSNDDLKLNGKYSNKPSDPYGRVMTDILAIARNYRQTYIIMWYPHTFGAVSETDDELSDSDYEALNNGFSKYNRYTSIIQEVIPTRTGLNELRSKVAVWLSSTNRTEPTKPTFVYQKEWTEDDHWTHYKNWTRN